MYELFPDLVYPCAFELAHACQIAIGRMQTQPLALDDIPSLFALVPRPASHADARIAGQILFEVTALLTREHHHRFHGARDDVRCKFDPGSYVVHVCAGSLTWEEIDVPTIVRDWVRRYAAGFTATHGSDIAVKAQVWMANRGTSVRCIEHMARDLGCSPATLWRRLKAETGESPIRSRRRARAMKAFVLLRTTTWKVDAIAAEVGWRSATNLYRAFEVLLGLTPADIRRVSSSEASELLNRLNTREKGCAQGSAVSAADRTGGRCR